VNGHKASRAMFSRLVMPVVEKFCQGFNAAVLAYGQTGSGKVRARTAVVAARGCHQQSAGAGASPLKSC
jgi:hypothetical protein